MNDQERKPRGPESGKLVTTGARCDRNRGVNPLAALDANSARFAENCDQSAVRDTVDPGGRERRRFRSRLPDSPDPVSEPSRHRDHTPAWADVSPRIGPPRRAIGGVDSGEPLHRVLRHPPERPGPLCEAWSRTRTRRARPAIKPAPRLAHARPTTDRPVRPTQVSPARRPRRVATPAARRRVPRVPGIRRRSVES